MNLRAKASYVTSCFGDASGTSYSLKAPNLSNNVFLQKLRWLNLSGKAIAFIRFLPSNALLSQPVRYILDVGAAKGEALRLCC